MRGSPQGLAIVTGAAGGMGRAVTDRLAATGRPLLLCDFDQDRLTSIVDALRERRCAVESFAGDIADADYADRLLATLDGREVDVLVHTAGLSPTMGDAKRIVSVNFDATIRLIDAVRLRMAVGGCVVLISSSSAHMVRSEETDRLVANAVEYRNGAALLSDEMRPEMAYPLSKKAVIQLVAREAAAFGERGVRIVSISPGLIDTPMSSAEMQNSEQMTGLLARTPLRRLGRADEIASVAAFLCSSDASYVTGCDIRVDGGTLAAIGC